MTTITTWTRLDIGPRTGDVVEQHQLIIRWDDQGYTQIHEDALGPLLRLSGYELDRQPCPVDPADCDHPSWTGVDQTPLDDPRKIWRCDVCEVLQVGDGNGPTEEAAALRSAPVATETPVEIDSLEDDHCRRSRWCGLMHGHAGPHNEALAPF